MPETLIHNLDQQPVMQPANTNPLMIMMIIGAVLLGFGTGFGISKLIPASTSSSTASNTKATADGKTAAGIADKSTFKDSAEGLLKEGGIDGEGSFHLERPGGESQNVYLTSSTVDLSAFVGKKVKVMGQTFSSDKAGWLMDVGYVELQ